MVSAQPGLRFSSPRPGAVRWGLGSDAAGERAGRSRAVRPAPLGLAPPGSVGRPAARRCRCPSGFPTATPRGGGAAPSGLPTSAPRSRPRLPRLLAGAQAGAPRRRRGGLLGGGCLGSGQKPQGAHPERGRGRHPPRPGNPGLVMRPTRPPGPATGRPRRLSRRARRVPAQCPPPRRAPWQAEDSQPGASGAAAAGGKDLSSV